MAAERDAYAVERIVDDMLALRRELALGPAVWVGHDWGAPIVWALAAFHPEACRAVANLCVPYFADGFSPDVLVPLVDRTVYPEETYPTGQWDYQYYYETAFDEATATFEADLAATFKTLIRSGSPAFRGRLARTAHVTRDGGWFDGRGRAPDLPRDPILSEADLAAYVAAFSKTGFAGADAWYANRKANRAYGRTCAARRQTRAARSVSPRSVRRGLRDARLAARGADASRLREPHGARRRERSLDGAANGRTTSTTPSRPGFASSSSAS